MKTFKDLLIELNACDEAIEFAAEMTIEKALNKCERGDWILWLAKKLNVDIRLLTLAKGRSAETVIHLMKDERSRNAVKIAIKFGNNECGLSELNAAAAAAYVYADAYAADAPCVASATYAAAAYARKSNQLLTSKICRELLAPVIINKVNNQT